MQDVFHYNEIDFEANLQDFFTCTYYKEIPFSGTLIHENTTTEFKNGNAHGRSLEYNDNGQLIEESFFEDGNYISYKTLYSNGQIKSESSDGKDSFTYDIDGNMILMNSDFFYTNGNFRKKNIPNRTQYYNSNGELAVIIEDDLQDYERTKIRNTKFYFHKERLFACYMDLYFELYPYISSYKDNLGNGIIGWLWYLLSQNDEYKKFAINAINNLLNDKRNHNKYDLEYILRQIEKIDLTNTWKKYYSEIIELKL